MCIAIRMRDEQKLMLVGCISIEEYLYYMSYNSDQPANATQFRSLYFCVFLFLFCLSLLLIICVERVVDNSIERTKTAKQLIRKQHREQLNWMENFVDFPTPHSLVLIVVWARLAWSMESIDCPSEADRIIVNAWGFFFTDRACCLCARWTENIDDACGHIHIYLILW